MTDWRKTITIDFVFVNPALTDLGLSVSIGDHGTWAKASDLAMTPNERSA